MQILEQRIYRGPNPYAHFGVIRLRLDLGPLEDWPSAKLPGFVDALLAAVPTLDEHGCSYGTPGGFVRRLREDEGTWLGHVLEHVAIELQNLAGADVTFGKTRGTGKHGEYFVVYQFEEERVGVAAGELALRLLCSLLPPELRPEPPDEGFDFAVELPELIAFAQRRQLGPSTASLVRAAEERDIPWIRLNDYSLVQFGHGRYQQRIQATITSQTRHIAVEIASDKEETTRILGDLGLPVPRQEVVYSEAGALEAADDVGYPVVVKPVDANHGRGVSIDLRDQAAVTVAFAKAKEHSSAVIVESFIPGFDHRMLVVGGRLVAVAKRVPGHVVGDGACTIAELVELVNRDPRRGIGHEKVLTRIELDDQAMRLLALAGFTPQTVLPEGEPFYLRSTGNLSTGGTATDMTDVVHPDNAEMATRAAQAIGLDVAGIDFITPDISRSHREVGGAICEVNAAPGFRMHVAPTEGRPRDVAGPVMDMLFPPGTPARIPIVSITGTNGKTTASRMVAHILKMSGHTVGLCTTDGVYIDGSRTVVGDMTGPVSAQMVLRDPTVDAAVLETARGGLLRSGLGYRSNDVGVVLNVQGDHLGLGGVETLDDLARIKRIVIEVSRGCAVLNADDERCLKMADHTSARRIAYVTQNPRHELVREHIRAGGAACVLEEGINGQMITLYDNGGHMPLLWTDLIPATLEGKAMFNVSNAMFAATVAFVMGIKLENIRTGLRTFDTTFFQAPGRLNVYDELPFKVILDYGHNPAAVAAMADTARRMDVTGRRLCVLSAPGDRRDQDVLDVARAAAGVFDHVILRRDDDPRGREEGEVTGLLRQGLLEAGQAEGSIEVIEDEMQAVAAVLEQARAGDLVVVFGDQITRCWKQIIGFGGEGETRRGRARELLDGMGGIGALATEAAPSSPARSPAVVEAIVQPRARELSRARPLSGTPGVHEPAPVRTHTETPAAPAVAPGGVISDTRGVRLVRERETSD
ncbi:cyanophycin synthetase [Paraliomyxa miuraensis]|uniref:cyanophycin synthetase n=1 Tax=Paraliomyxa miuraensis TaxID=376150 RepID=UPI0022591FB8|nr:cyanophycin synthetase [Paraliomyxa miuraensis]MCX4246306.1 cyanophycin synthetase [Paraliomyxa miuraensis]